MTGFREVIALLISHGFLISSIDQVLSGDEDDATLAKALQGRLTICPTFDMDPVAVFDGHTFHAPHLVAVLKAVASKLISWS